MPQIFQLSASWHSFFAASRFIFTNIAHCFCSARCVGLCGPAPCSVALVVAGRVDNSFVCKSQQSKRQSQTATAPKICKSAMDESVRLMDAL